MLKKIFTILPITIIYFLPLFALNILDIAQPKYLFFNGKLTIIGWIIFFVAIIIEFILILVTQRKKEIDYSIRINNAIISNINLILNKSIQKITSVYKKYRNNTVEIVNLKKELILSKKLTKKEKNRIISTIDDTINIIDECFNIKENTKNIGEAIFFSFRNITSYENLKVSILQCNNYKIDDFIFIYPDINTFVKADTLNEQNSTAKYVLNIKKDMVIIEDTNKNKLPFYNAPNTPINHKVNSLICYPVLDYDNNVIFIITITSRTINIFNKKYFDLYNKLLYNYTRDLLKDYYLFKIREDIL